MLSGFVRSVACALFGAAMLLNAVASAQSPLATTALVGTGPVFEQIVEVPSAGQYQLTVRDAAFPQRAVTLAAALFTGARSVAGVSLVAAGAAEGTATFDATAGTHVLRVVGQPGSSGSASFTASLRPAGAGATTAEIAGALNAALPSNGQLLLNENVVVAAPGTYRLTLQDHAFPAPLAALTARLLDGPATLGTLAGPGGVDVTIPAPGTYTLLVVAEAAAARRLGVAGVRLAGAAGTPFDRPLVIGDFTVDRDAPLATTGPHALELVDFAFPQPLTALRAVLLRAGSVLLRADAAGSTSANLVAGPGRLLLDAVPASGAPGSLGARLTSGSTVVASITQSVPASGAGGDRVAVVPFDVAASGAFEVRLTDFRFPAPFAAISFAVTQGGAIVAQSAAPGTVTAQLAPGPAFVLGTGAPTATSGLYGLRIAQAGATGPVVELTGAFGAQLVTRTLPVAAAGAQRVTLEDLRFPRELVDLALLVTRGDTAFGSLFNGGQLDFPAAPGDYRLNLIARAATGSYGAYGLAAGPAPSPPTVTLGAANTSVASGGTTTLTWSSTGATSCTASGAWSGSRATSGSATSAAISAQATFTLRCEGAGGSASASVTVSPSAPSVADGGGGSGALGGAALAALLAIGALRRRRLARRD